MDNAVKETLEQSGLPRRVMYRVEKFSPQTCPKCQRPFRQIGDDWAIYFGKIVEGKKVPDPEWPRIRCAGCNELVKITMIEEYQLGDKAQAERLVAEEGFCNLLEVEAVGSHALQDFHVVHKGRGTLEVVQCEEPPKS